MVEDQIMTSPDCMLKLYTSWLASYLHNIYEPIVLISWFISVHVATLDGDKLISN